MSDGERWRETGRERERERKIAFQGLNKQTLQGVTRAVELWMTLWELLDNLRG